MTSTRHALAALLLALSGPALVVAQPGQYTAPGSLGDPPEDRQKRFQSAIEEARWNVGGLRIDPWVALKDVSIVKDEVHDGELTASAGAGLRFYLPVGGRTIIAAHVLPNYIWWSDSSEESRLAGRLGLGVFYEANRLRAELFATAQDQDALATAEVNRRVGIEDVHYYARLEFPIAPRFSAYLSANRYTQDINDPNPSTESLESLNQTTGFAEAGVGWEPRETLRLFVGYGYNRTDFDETSGAPDRSNEGEFISAGARWSRQKTRVEAVVRKYDLSPTSGSTFPEFTSTTWRGMVNWAPKERFSTSLYGQRELSYSVYVGQTAYLDERIGVRVAFPIGKRIQPSLYYETGSHVYLSSDREDDVTSWGANLGIPIYKQIHLSAYYRVTETEPEGDLPSSYDEVGFRLSFGGLGESHGGWY